MRFSSLLLAAVTGLAFGLAGCGDVSSVGAPMSSTATPPVLHSGLPSETLLQKMQVAPTAVAYSGVRRIEQSWQVGETVYSTSYREDVASDGQGRVALQSLELIAPSLPPRSEELWRMLQESRDGFLFRYRDFRIHDVTQMVTNYSPIATGVRLRGVHRCRVDGPFQSACWCAAGRDWPTPDWALASTSTSFKAPVGA
ncbi:MAG: hypothetical protein ACKO4Q_15950, partial [Planctomycetota bacterium]